MLLMQVTVITYYFIINRANQRAVAIVEARALIDGMDYKDIQTKFKELKKNTHKYKSDYDAFQTNFNILEGVVAGHKNNVNDLSGKAQALRSSTSINSNKYSTILSHLQEQKTLMEKIVKKHEIMDDNRNTLDNNVITKKINVNNFIKDINGRIY